MKSKIGKIIILAFAVIIVSTVAMPVTSYAEDEGENYSSEMEFLSEKGIKIGVDAGTVYEALVREAFPEAEVVYCGKLEGYTAVAQGKLDAYVYDRRQMLLAVENGASGVRVLDETLGEATSIALGISSVSDIPELTSNVNDFIAEVKADGTLDDMFDRWVIKGNFNMPEIDKPSSPAYHMTVGTTGDVEPYNFYQGDKLTGYDIELMYRFGAWLNADVQFQTYDWNSIIASLQTGKADVVASNLQITPERAEEIIYSDILFEEENGIMVRDTLNAQAALQWQDYIGKRIGVLTGTPLETVAEENFAGSEILYFNSYPDCVTALLAGEIDAYLCDEPNANMTHHEEPRIDYIHERLTHNDYAFAFRKDDAESAALLSEFNAFLKKIKQDGTYEEIEDIWFGTDESRKFVDIGDLTGESGTITIATTSTDMPWSFIKENKNVGFDIDIVARFCKEKGYELDIMDVDFAARIPALQSGKCDFTTDMNVTPERQEEVLFSDATADGGVVVVTLAENLTTPGSIDEAEGSSGGKDLLKGVKDSFYKTFIRESRYKLFLKGILTTIVITLLSVLFGTALGFLVYMGCRKDGKVSNAIAGFFVWLIQGMPIVVLLMILYYIIFAHADVSGRAVAIFAFTLVFGSGVFGMLKSGVGAIDSGQTEAALSLGYGDIHAFFRIILPQALPHFLPAYKGEIVTLLKATAIVGYIAVQDLTKMGDIVRGRTYEAFFPLIAVAVIYFILAAVFKFIVGTAEALINPRRRKREDILKGVRVHD